TRETSESPPGPDRSSGARTIFLSLRKAGRAVRLTSAAINELFAEKLELLLKLRESDKVTWVGTHRAAIDNLGVYPRPVQDVLPALRADHDEDRPRARLVADDPRAI